MIDTHLAPGAWPGAIKVRAASPSFTATAINDFMGTDTVEVGAHALVLAALDTKSPTGSFTGPDGPLPW